MTREWLGADKHSVMPLRRTIIPWIAPWVIALFAIVVALLAAGLLIRNSVAASFDTGQRVRNAGALLFSAVKAQLDEETGLRGYLATRDPAFLEPYRSARAHLPGIFARLKTALEELNVPSAVAAASDAQRANDAWTATVAVPLLAHDARSTLTLQRAGKNLVDRFRADWTVVEDGLAMRNDDVRNDLQGDLVRLSVLIAVAALLLLTVGLSFAMLTARAWNKLEHARQQREAARIRERDLRSAYETERRVADTLQEAFSQRVLPVTPSIAFSATYVPAAEEAKVGGDWYDAFEIGPDRILFTIGDIAGHGLEAAVTMSRVRNEMLSAALLYSNVESILARVNERIVRSASAVPMVTAIVGIADARTCEFEYSTAGHPPPVLVEPGQQPRLLAFGGLPLGISETPVYRRQRVKTVPGAMLVLYTDGAVEHSRNIVEGERILLETIAGITDQAHAATAIYRTIFNDRLVADDVAILTIEFATKPPLISTASAGRLELVAKGTA
jgi:serine phosphatase RsbU (regulator of sigma subunit)/CHASE3 domain sensor protein